MKPQTEPAVQRRPWLILGSTAAVLALVLWWSFGPGADADRPYGTALVATARYAAVLFLLSFIARPLARVAPAGTALLRNRRYLGLAFALVHLTHGALVVAWARSPQAELDPVTVIGGGLAYGLVLLMALTSNDASVRWLGRWWKRLHSVGAYYVWFIFALTFYGRGISASVATGMLLLMVLAILARLVVAKTPQARSVEQPV